MDNKFIKEIGLITDSQYKKLNDTLIILFGLGGVGGYVFEALVRVGINNFIIVDKDKFEMSNFNRQLAADNTTIGQYKTDIYKLRAQNINNNCNIINININVNENNIIDIMSEISEFKNHNSICVIDAVDDINAKLEIIKYCKKNNLKIISSMGTANHISSENIRIDDIFKTKYCPISKIIRKKLKENNIENLTCLYFEEEQLKNDKNILSTISYIPSICGLKIAEYVIRKII